MGNKIKKFKIGDAVIQIEAGWSTSEKDNGKMAIITEIDEENDNIRLFGDEEWEAKYEWRHINGFESVNEMIKKLPQPIQKEEVKTATEMMVKDMQEEEYYRIKHTTSDTFIEDKVKQFDNHFEAILTYWGAAGIRKDLNQFLKSSLQEQRQSILEEIENKAEQHPRKSLEDGFTPEPIAWREGYNLALEDIKQLLK